MTTAIDPDKLPPTQYLICELLAARHRTGVAWWPLPTRLRTAMTALTAAGLIEVQTLSGPGVDDARLTAAGRALFMPDDWTPPPAGDLAALLRYAAQGRREYLHGMPADMLDLVEVEADTLDQAAIVADGRLEPLYGWLPSLRWTEQMRARWDGDS